MAQKKSKTKREIELEFRWRQRRGELIASIINNVIRWGGIVLIVWAGYKSIAALSGQQTSADFLVRVFTNVKVAEILKLLFGAGGIAYGLRERSLRKSTTERIQPRNKMLKQHIDSKRSSSGLTPRGDTHPEDL